MSADEFDITFSQDLEAFRQQAHAAVDRAVDYLAQLRQKPVFAPMTPEERQALVQMPLSEQGESPEALLAFAQQQLFSHPMGNGHPRFFGWVNSPPSPYGALADFLAAILNPSCAGGDHAAIYLEHGVIRWLMQLVGFPTEGSYGLLVSGGSMAALIGLAAARHWAAGQLGWNDRKAGMQQAQAPLILYLSSEGHSCIIKAAELLGLGAEHLRVIPTDASFRLDVEALRAAIKQDRAAGAHPFCVAASAGTVNTGAIDPLNALADLCEEESLWLHVDGAYGAVGRLDPDVAPLYAGMERAHSLSLDPHKWLSVPVECGCAMVRDGGLLRDTFSLVPPYLRLEPGKGFSGLPWFSEYGFQQTRGFRALKVWMTLQSAGYAGLQQRARRHNRLARLLAELVDADPDFERTAPVTLSVVCFRYAPPALRGDEARLEQVNRAIAPQVQAEGEAFLTGTTLRERFTLRACIIHDATTAEDVRALLEIVRRAGQSQLASQGA